MKTAKGDRLLLLASQAEKQALNWAADELQSLKAQQVNGLDELSASKRRIGQQEDDAWASQQLDSMPLTVRANASADLPECAVAEELRDMRAQVTAEASKEWLHDGSPKSGIGSRPTPTWTTDLDMDFDATLATAGLLPRCCEQGPDAMTNRGCTCVPYIVQSLQ